MQRGAGRLTVPAVLGGLAALALVWILAVGSLQAIQSALLLLPLMVVAFVYGAAWGLAGAALVGTLGFALALGLPDPQRIGRIPPINQAWVLMEFAFVTVLCMVGLRRYVARSHRQAIEAQSLRVEDEQLRALNQRLQMAVEAGQFGVWDYDVERRRFSFDAMQARLYGLPPTVTGATLEEWLQAVHPEDRGRARTEFSAVIEQDRAYDLTFRIRQRGGAGGRADHVVGLDRDVTGQEVQAQALRDAGERLTMAVSAAGGVAWVVGPDRSLQWNARGLELYGLDLFEHPDGWLDVVLPEDQARTAAAWRAALADGGAPGFEFEFRIRHRQRGPAAASMRPTAASCAPWASTSTSARSARPARAWPSSPSGWRWPRRRRAWAPGSSTCARAASPGTRARRRCTACRPSPARSGRCSGPTGSSRRTGPRCRPCSTAAPSAWNGRCARSTASPPGGACARWPRRCATTRAWRCGGWVPASTSPPSGWPSAPSSARARRPSSPARRRAPSSPT
ncbi:PAS domain-containing protein [Piscinibacter sakaiensis]|uniref:PAS domain-containing protein n=1 Tax=Piscinibacter sakaiensis TaxID=1547922 RepID=UPI003729D850